MVYYSDFDITILAICGVLLLIILIARGACERHCRFKYKDQKVGTRTKRWRR